MAVQGKVIGAVAGILVVVLLAVCGGLLFLNQQQAGRTAGLEEAVLKAGAAAGLEDLTPEVLKNTAALPEALQRLNDTIQAQRQELETTKETLATAGSDAASAKSEAIAQTQRAEEQAAKATALTQELAGKDAEIATAKADAAKAEQEKQALQQESAKLKTDLEVAQQKLQTVTAAATAAGVVLPTEEDAAAAEAATAEEAVAPPTGEAVEPAAKPSAAAEEEEEAGREIGKSEMFKSIKYTAASQTLIFRLVDGQKLTYTDVPGTVYGGMLNSTDIDKYYRFKIQGVFASTPDDKQAIRDFWRHIRNRPVSRDVKVID